MRTYETATALIARRTTARLTQTELIKRMNEMRMMFQDLDVKDAELGGCMRITQKDLEAVLNRINTKAGHPDAKYSTPGAYLLDGAYGGWKLAQYCNEHGGQRDITNGFVPKRELYDLMHAYLRGMEAVQ